MIMLAAAVAILWIAIALIKGMLRWLVLIAGIAFIMFYLGQPATLPATARAQIAAQDVIKAGSSTGNHIVHSKLVINNWQKLTYEVKHLM